MDTIRKTIIDALLEKNRLTASEAAGFDKFSTNEQIEKKLREDKLVSSEDIAKAYAVVYDLPFIRLESYDINQEAFRLIPTEIIVKDKIIGFDRVGDEKIKIAVASPGMIKNNPPAILADLKEKKGLIVDLYVTTLEDIQKVVARLGSAATTKVEVAQADMSYPQMNNLKTVDLKSEKIPYDVISKFPVEISQKYKMVVFASPDVNTIRVAISDPTDVKVREILDFVRDRNEIKIEEFVASPAEIDEAIKLYYKKPEDTNVVVEQEITNSLEKSLTQKETEENIAKPEPQKEEKIEKPNHSGFSDFLNKSVTHEKTEVKHSPALSQSETQKIIARAADEAKINATNLTQNIKPGVAPVRRKFVRRPIPFDAQAVQEQQVQAQAEETAASAVIAPENDLDQFLGQPVKNIETFKNIVQTGNVPQILAALVALAVNMKASDIHIEAEGEDVRFRFRVDGILKDILKAPLPLHAALISRIKILSRLKIDEARVPQDGRFDVKTNGHEIDLRVSTLPTVRGEKAALRILDKSQNIYTLEDLGFSGRNLKVIEENITKPYGVILATGPTGSGKSTTLYSILKKVSSPAVNVITLEDPVEYEMPGINQCQVKPKIGFSFAEGLRSVLRQDPNIIMVGEVRDAETAGMATHAALTGHLVLTTLHTNDAAGALPRLTNMGIEPFLITSSINVVIGQRLVRKICPKCKHEANLPAQMLEEIQKELASLNLPQPYKFYEAEGCAECNNGYSGRLGIYEVLAMTEKIEELAIARRPSSEIKEAAVADGMITMKQDGLMKAVQGLTTVSEVLRVTLTE
ncbi:MAG: type II/IV secretion system protein [Candidatus Berkelbacteria bacterium]